MALTRWAFVYTADGTSSDGEVTVVDTGSCRTIFLGVPGPEHAAPLIVRLVDEQDLQLVELCGGFGPVWAGRIIEAIGPRVPVGIVAYGPESVDGVHAIFS